MHFHLYVNYAPLFIFRATFRSVRAFNISAENSPMVGWVAMIDSQVLEHFEHVSKRNPEARVRDHKIYICYLFFGVFGPKIIFWTPITIPLSAFCIFAPWVPHKTNDIGKTIWQLDDSSIE